MRFRELLALPAIMVLAATIVGCSGGQTVLTPTPAPAPTHAPTHAPTSGPTTTPTTEPTTTPTTSPTTTPSPTPTPASPIVLNPNSIVVAPTGSGCTSTETFQASETGYSGSFSAASANTTIATVTPTQMPGQSFTVTGAATAVGGQSTTITVTDTLGHSATEPVSIAICLP